MLECVIIYYRDGTILQVFKFLSAIMPEVIVLHGFLVLTMFYMTAGSCSTNHHLLIATDLLPSIYPSNGRRQDPVFIVKLEGHSDHVQEGFQPNASEKYEITLPCETGNEALTAITWTYSENNAQILEIKDKYSKIKRAATKNTPKEKKKPKPTVTKTNKKRVKNIKTVPKITKKSPPAKSKKKKKKKTTTKTAKKKLSKSKKKALKSTIKKSGKPTKQITINAKTSKYMENSDETERKKIIKAKPTNEMALTTVKRVQPTNKMALTTVKRTKPTKKIALTTVKRKKMAYNIDKRMALTNVRSTNQTKKITLTTVKRAKTTKETVASATKEEIPSVKATQNPSTKNFYGLFKIKTKQKISENGEVLGSTNKFPLLQDFNKNIFTDKYQGVFPIKSRTNEVNSTGKLFKLEEEQNSTTEIVTRTKLTKKTALTTVTKPTMKTTMKTSKSTKPTNTMTLTTIKIAKPTNKTTLKTVKKTRPTKKRALTTVSKGKPTNKMTLIIIKTTKSTNKTTLTTVKRTKPTKKMSLTTVKRTKPTVETILTVTKEKVPAVEKATQNNSTKNFYGLFKIKTKQKIPENGEVLGSTKKFPFLQDFNENTIMDKYQGAFSIKSRTNEVDSTGRLIKLEEEQNSTEEIVKRTKLTKKTALTTVTKPTNKITIKTIKKTKPTNKMTLATIKIAKLTNKTSMTTVRKTRPTKKMVLTTVKKAKLTNKMTLTTIKRTKPTNKTTLITVKSTKPTKKMSLTTEKRTKPTMETILSITKENIPAVEITTQNNYSKNIYGPLKIKKKQKLPEKVEVLGTTTRKFSLLQEFRGRSFMDKYQGVYPAKPRTNESISTGKLFKLEEQRNNTRETVKRTKPTKELTIKPTKKMSLTAVKRTKPTTKMALATVKRTKPTKEKISTLPKEEIPVVEKVTQNNSTKNFYGLFKIKTKQKIPQNGEVLGSTKKFPLLQDFNENTFMNKYHGVFPIKSRMNEVISTGRLFKLEEEQNSTTEIVKRTKRTKKTALTTVTKPMNKMTMKTINRTKPTNKMTLKTIKIAKSTKKMSLTTVKRTKPTVETLLSVIKGNIPAVEKATQSNSSKNFYGPFTIKKKQKLPENGEVLGTKTRKSSVLQELRGNTFVDKYQGVYPVKPRKNEAISTGKLFNLEKQRNHTRKTVKRTKPTKKLATKPTKKASLTAVKRTNPTKKMTLATVKRTKTTMETISTVAKEEIPVVEKVTQNNSTKIFYGLVKIKTKQNIPENGEVVGSTERFPLLQDFNKNTFMDKCQGVFPIKSRTNEVNSTGRLFKLEEEQNSTKEVVKRTKLTKKTALTTVTKPMNKMTMKTIKSTKPRNKITLTTLKIAKQTNKMALTDVKKTRPTKKMALITVKRTKPTVETILSVTKENIQAVEKAKQNNSSKNFYGPFKIKKKQKLPENGEVLGTTTRKFPLLQEFRGRSFMDKYQGVYPAKPRTNESISTGKLFKLEEQRNNTRETVKRTKPTKELTIKPTKKMSLTVLKRTKLTKKMALATVKRTKPTMETILTVAKEEIPVVEKVTQNNSTKIFYGLFKIKTKPKLPEYTEVLVTTIRNFPPLPESNGNTLMCKYQGVFTLLLLLLIWPVLWTR